MGELIEVKFDKRSKDLFFLKRELRKERRQKLLSIKNFNYQRRRDEQKAKQARSLS